MLIQGGVSRRTFLVGRLEAAASLQLGLAFAQNSPSSRNDNLHSVVARYAEPFPIEDEQAFGAMFDRFADVKVALPNACCVSC